MRTFLKCAVGLQVTQLHLDNFLLESFLHDLEFFVNEGFLNFSIDQNFEEELNSGDFSDIALRFLKWWQKNAEQLKSLNISAHAGVNNTEEHPIILGLYIDHLFKIPTAGAMALDFSKLNKIQTLLLDIQTIFSTLDQDILDLINQNNLINIWLNSHSV